MKTALEVMRKQNGMEIYYNCCYYGNTPTGLSQTHERCAMIGMGRMDMGGMGRGRTGGMSEIGRMCGRCRMGIADDTNGRDGDEVQRWAAARENVLGIGCRCLECARTDTQTVMNRLS